MPSVPARLRMMASILSIPPRRTATSPWVRHSMRASSSMTSRFSVLTARVLCDSDRPSSFPVRITVRNEGEGSMPGTVSSNVPWMQISPSQLDPNRRTQVIEALVEPDGISGNAAKGVVTIDTLHGESRTVTIDAIKHIVSPVMLFVTALSLVGFIGLFAGLYLSGIIGSSGNVTHLNHLGG